MSEAVIRQRLIRLSCAKLIAFKKTSEGLRRSLHVLAVLKHAHSDDARFEPECSDLLRPQPNRLVVILETPPPQRISSPSPSPPSPPPQDHVVPSPTENEQPIETDSTGDPDDQSMIMETEDSDGTSMARKRKNHHAHNSYEYSKGGEKRLCENSTGTPPTSKSLESLSSSSSSSSSVVDNNNNTN